MREAADNLSIELQLLDAASAHEPLSSLMPGDGLYRIGSTHAAKMLEFSLITPHISTFYASNELVFRGHIDSFFYHRYHELPIIPTIATPSANHDVLAEQAAQLGGFPIILKILGGYKGVGVIRADSQAALSSLVDYLVSVRAHFVLRKYIPHTYQGRLVVIGDNVVASTRHSPAATDFRSNIAGRSVREKASFTPDVHATAIRAVQVLGYEAGGVDVLFAENGHHYLAEVNFPFGFSAVQEHSGVNIASLLLEHLRAKSNRTS